MASLLDIATAGQRAPLSVYLPGRQQQQPARRPARLAPRRRVDDQQPTGSWTEWSQQVASTPAAQQARQQEVEGEQEQEGFWGSDFGRGLGFVINNPVTRAVTTPINYLQTGGRAVTLGVQELAEALPEGPDWLNNLPAGSLAGLIARVDTDKTRADTRSNLEKVFSPNTTYGYGEIAESTGNKWLDRFQGLGGDIALDPLTYVGNVGARVTTGVAHATRAADELQLATRALTAAEKAGKAKDIAAATKRLAAAEEYVARAPELGTPVIRQQMPRTRAERVEFAGRLPSTPEGQRILAEFPEEIQRAGLRGYHTASPELKAALGIEPAGLRVRGSTAAIPGTRRISEGISQLGGALRAPASRARMRLPERLRNVRVPAGLEDEFAILGREATADVGEVFLAATAVGGRQRIRLGTGAQKARGGRYVTNMVRKGFKNKSKNQIQNLRRAAETSPTPNVINEITKGLVDTYASVTGRQIPEQYLRPWETYFPHLLDPRWRRALAAGAKRGDKAMQDFIKASDLKQDELLEEGAFFVDNMMEGSGFLEKARKVGLDKDGNPQTIKIAGKDVTFEADDVDYLNTKLREAFPDWKGDFYDTDPVRVLDAYNTSLARQAGRDLAAQQLVKEQNPLVATMTGDIEATRQAINAAERQRGAAPLLSTAQGRYDPTQPLPEVPTTPIVPGGREDLARRAAVMEALDEVELARTPEEMAAASQGLDVLPAPAERFGDVDPATYFGRTKGVTATAERNAQVTRARTYARAATAETRQAEARLRQGLADVKEELVTPIRTTIAETKKEITAINAKLRQWQKKVPALGALTTNNADEILLLESKISEQISNIETKIKRTRAQWKGRATRAQRKAEQELRVSLDRLRHQRDAIAKKVREAPIRMQEEYNARLEVLDRPVKEARALLDAKEDEFITMRPAPYGQGVVDAARDVVAKSEGFAENDILNAQRGKYRTVLEEITDINTRRNKTGGLTRADRTRMNQLVKEADELKATLQQAINRQTKVSPYDQAEAALHDLRAKLLDTPQAEVPALQRQIDEAASQFAPGGKFAKERRARRIVRLTDQWDADLAAHTQAERATWEKAQSERGLRQEAIVWARSPEIPEHMRTRHVVAPGRPPSELEQMGWRAGESRYPEPITGGVGFEGEERIPQPAAWKTERVIEDVVGGEVSPGGTTVRGPDVVRRPGPVPTPRTEEEALLSLQNQLKYGSPAQQATRIPLAEAEQNLLDAATKAPHELPATKAEIAEKMGKMADQEVGPLSQQAKTYENLATDMADKAKLIGKRDQNIELRDRLNDVNPKYLKSDLGKTIDEIESVARDNPQLDDVKLAQTESLLNTHRDELQRVGDTKMRISDLDRVVADAESGELGNVMVASLNDNWRALHAGPLNTGDIIMDAELHKRFTNLFEVSKQPKMLGRYFNAATNLFKTYATLTPGFFIRNSIGGVFMNTSDGVGLRVQTEGVNLWRKFIDPDTPPDWLDYQPRRVQDAFAAAFASGAGGRFEDVGVLAKTNSRAYNMLSSNPATRLGQRAGTKVEGAMRLGMALDSVDKGMDVTEALARISRVHFDYAQTSQLDDVMKRIIPFWTFMSRNLPLQIQQQWTNPRVYSYYNHLVANFSLPDEEFTPEYWTRQGAWRTPVDIAGMPLYAQPDLGFNRVTQDIKMLGAAAGGQEYGQALAQVNPLIAATYDFMTRRDSFYNRTFEPTDFKKMSGVVGTPLTAVARVFGQTNEAGQVDENFINYMTSLNPVLSQAERLLPGTLGQDATANTWAKRARWAGAPTQLLTPASQESEYWRQWREMQDEAERQQAMALEAAG